MSRICPFVVILVAATIRAQVPSAYQSIPACGCSERQSPFYKLLTSASVPKYQALQARPAMEIVSLNPTPSCSCFSRYPQSPFMEPTVLNPVELPFEFTGISPLSGVIMPPSGPLQKSEHGTILQSPTPVYMSPPPFPPDPKTDTGPSSDYTSSSHIMTIPRNKCSNDAPSPKSNADVSVLQTLIPPASPNSIYSVTPLVSSEVSPQPLFYTQQAPLVASCPATVFYPVTPPIPYTQPAAINYPNVPIAHAIPKTLPSPSYTPPSTSNYTPSSVPLTPVTNNSALTAAATAVSSTLSPTSTAAASSVKPKQAGKDNRLTYTLMGNTKPKDAFASSFEVESRDCSVPIPPILV